MLPLVLLGALTVRVVVHLDPDRHASERDASVSIVVNGEERASIPFSEQYVMMGTVHDKKLVRHRVRVRHGVARVRLVFREMVTDRGPPYRREVERSVITVVCRRDGCDPPTPATR